MPYRIRVAEEANLHLARLTARQRATVLGAIERQLLHQPAVETRNRKRMQAHRAGLVASWELRVAGHLRVYYDVLDQTPAIVLIVAVGVKDRNRVRIGDFEIEAP